MLLWLIHSCDLSAHADPFILTPKATVFDTHGAELSGERGTSTAFSGEGEKPRQVVS